MQKIRQDDSGNIGKNIRRMRIYSQIEGGTYNIRVVELAALKIIFDVDYSDFFEGAEEGLVTR